MRKLLSVLLTVCMLFSMFAVFTVSTSAASTKYISSFMFAGADDGSDLADALSDASYTALGRYVSDGEGGSTYEYYDFNSGNIDYYLYLGYQTTTNSYAAIRDLIVLKGSEYKNVDKWLNPVNGCYYQVVGGLDEGTEVKAFNINVNFDDEEPMYLFVTYDSKAGNPIYDLDASETWIITEAAGMLYGEDGKYANLSSSVVGNAVLYYKQVKYFSSLQIGAADDEDVAEDNACINNYRLLYPLTDLNNNAGGDYIYLSYQLTGDSSQAIRDIICIDGKKYDGVNEFYNSENGCTYTAIKGYIEEDTNTLKTVDVNRNAGGDYLWLFYTTDPKAGDPITNISFYDVLYNSLSDEEEEMAVKFPYGGVADLNKNAGGDYVYMLCEHTKLSNAGSIFSEGTLPFVIIAGGVLIVAGGVAAFLIKRKKQAATC